MIVLFLHKRHGRNVCENYHEMGSTLAIKEHATTAEFFKLGHSPTPTPTYKGQGLASWNLQRELV
jgi:hypothetical protein